MNPKKWWLAAAVCVVTIAIAIAALTSGPETDPQVPGVDPGQVQVPASPVDPGVAAGTQEPPADQQEEDTGEQHEEPAEEQENHDYTRDHDHELHHEEGLLPEEYRPEETEVIEDEHHHHDEPADPLWEETATRFATIYLDQDMDFDQWEQQLRPLVSSQLAAGILHEQVREQVPEDGQITINQIQDNGTTVRAEVRVDTVIRLMITVTDHVEAWVVTSIERPER